MRLLSIECRFRERPVKRIVSNWIGSTLLQGKEGTARMELQRKKLTDKQEAEALYIRHPNSAPPLEEGMTLLCMGAFGRYQITIEEVLDRYPCNEAMMWYVITGRRDVIEYFHLGGSS